MDTLKDLATLPPLSPDRQPREEQEGAAQRFRIGPIVIVLFVSVLAFLLASFPARNSDLWMHLAAGRDLAKGEYSRGPSQTWLYDLFSYACYSALGGAGLVVVKGLVVLVIGLVLLRLAWTGQGWWLPVICTSLALLAMSTRAAAATSDDFLPLSGVDPVAPPP